MICNQNADPSATYPLFGYINIYLDIYNLLRNIIIIMIVYYKKTCKKNNTKYKTLFLECINKIILLIFNIVKMQYLIL